MLTDPKIKLIYLRLLFDLYIPQSAWFHEKSELLLYFSAVPRHALHLNCPHCYSKKEPPVVTYYA